MEFSNIMHMRSDKMELFGKYLIKTQCEQLRGSINLLHHKMFGNPLPRNFTR
jgi:hypothetical protein